MPDAPPQERSTIIEILSNEINILKIEQEAGISVEYMYAFTIKSGENAVLLFRFDDMDKAVAALCNAGLGVLDSVELYQRAES